VEIELHQIKKISLFKFIFLAFLPFGIIFSFFTRLMEIQYINLISILAALAVGVLFSCIITILLLLGAWIINIFKPDLIVLKLDDSFEKMKDAFK